MGGSIFMRIPKFFPALGPEITDPPTILSWEVIADRWIRQDMIQSLLWAELFPQKRFVEDLTPGTSECDLS